MSEVSTTGRTMAEMKMRIHNIERELAQERKWHHEVLDAIYEEMPDGMNERPDPRELVRSWRHASDGRDSLHNQLAEAKAEVEKLKGANARHVIAHIERICPDCGHNMDEDNRCATCLLGAYDMLRDEFQRILALQPTAEIKGICERAVSDIERRIPIIQERDSLTRRLKAWRECAEHLFKVSDRIVLRSDDSLWAEHTAALAAFDKLVNGEATESPSPSSSHPTTPCS